MIIPSGMGATPEQINFIRKNKDEMFVGQLAYLTGLERQTVKKYIRIVNI